MATPAQDENSRMEALLRYDILDTPAESGFDDITLLASQICETPIAIITLLDEKRQWFKSHFGIEITETPREIAFCAHTILQKELFVVEDAAQHPSFVSNPMVVADPHIRFYAGAPLVTPEGYAIGTLSVIDRVPRKLNDAQLNALRALSRNVVRLFELRRNMTMLGRMIEARDKAERALKQARDQLERKVFERTNMLMEEMRSRIQEKEVADALINSSPGIFYVFDRHGRFLRWNRNLLTVTGYSDEEMRHAHPLDFFPDEKEKKLVQEKIEEAFENGNVFVEACLLTKQGKCIPHLFSGTRIKVEGVDCISGMGMDITERKQFETSLIEAQERYRRLIEVSPEAIFVLKKDHCVFANEAAQTLLGARLEEICAQPFLRFVHPDYHELVRERIRLLDSGRPQVPDLEEKYVRMDGTVVDVHVTAATFMDNGEPARLVIVHDITEANKYKQQLERHANYDQLTQLANRNLLNDRINQSMAFADRYQASCAIGFLDLDNFKFVNDTLGHDIGDQLLIAVAERLKSYVREEDTVARYGGDEFVFVINDCGDRGLLEALINRMIHGLSQPLSICGNRIFMTCSIGLSMYPKDGADRDTLLKHADTAMYRAKAEGRNQCKFYAPVMNESVQHRYSIESRLRNALEHGEFLLHYQPQMDLRSGAVIGIEALLRWNSSEEGLVAPDRFISIAEETGLIIPIGAWVIAQACKDNKSLQQAGVPKLPVSVNLSARQLTPSSLIAAVEAALHAARLLPTFLKLELTETAIMSRPEEAHGIFLRLNEFGVKFAADDFGTGYSSLSYLQRFPMGQVKIDKSFIQDVAHNSNDAAIAQAIISLGHSLGMTVIAEGVSSPEQVEFLRARSCDAIQGYYYSKPLPLAELQAFLMPDCQ
ncbi:EAL domain-containing protein [Oxalobacteraceae bacterium R-40]|uniref:EAL domain-containing protein n=1 Tax=Keguizhuia sedimenti TaxID=3064264 RepID=A0ABU1BM55_9BURK|nr:EAL domain-containing protein [Oxalobacteraceae bacterium R-40]